MGEIITIGIAFATLVVWSWLMYKIGHVNGQRHEIERQNAELNRKYRYADYRQIDEQMTTSSYVDILNQTTRHNDND